MDSSFTNSRDDMATARRADADWHRMTRAEQIRSIELDGYVLVPDLLSEPQIEAIRAELDQLETTPVDYSKHQRGCPHVEQTDSPNALAVVALPAMIDFLAGLLGSELICTSIGFAVSEPGHPGIAIHTDSQPFGSRIFGVQASSPCLVRALYYLDDLTAERSPFKVIPRSHLSLHSDANPYNRYLSHPEELMVTCRAGSAVVINQRVFHGNYPNYSDRPRRMLAIAYRPSWAGPIADVDDRDPSVVAGLSPEIRPYFRSLNTRDVEFDLPNRPDNMRREAAGINPSRWKG